MSSPNGTKPPASSARPGKTVGGAHLVGDTSQQAKRQAAAILEVLAGARTPTQAAQALAVSLPRYYQLEERALRGLLQACEPKPKGRVRSAASELARLRQECDHLQRELTRQQSLVRLAQRSVGLVPTMPTCAKPAGKPGACKPGAGLGSPSQKRRQRRPVARALSVATRLQQESPPPADPSTPETDVAPMNP
jgi:hypothetical protein